ncbi:MAG TPA: S46 family peptidase [Blastocatellia bacterium]|nr:S46 family peptidase [Blastocatellia bacterium]
MDRRKLILTWLVFTLILCPFSSLADEGMWMPDSLDKLLMTQLKKRGFELKPEEVYSLTKPSLKDAIVQINAGGTGSFVSPEGLVLTNHHIAFFAVTTASSTEHDYIEKGFLAKSRAEEIPARGYSISITQDYKDVTAEVLAAAKPEMSVAERLRAMTAKQDEIAQSALKGRQKEGIRTQVVEATGGYQYFLYTYLTLPDVRLVYAPPKSIGYFGGDPDNFEWPRHCGDFAFLRAYLGPDGKPANFNQNNVPYKPKKFLPINATGVKDGDFAMIMGYPGITYRYRESYSVEYRQQVQLPNQIAALRRQIETLNKLGEKDPALKIRLANQIFTLSNSLKAFEGTLEGLKRMNLVQRKREEEAAFAKWLDGNPAMKTTFGEVLPQIAAAYAELNSFSQKQYGLNNLLDAGELINVLTFAYARALEREKPAAERSSQFGEATVRRLTMQLEQRWRDRTPDSETELMVGALKQLAALPDGQKLPFVENLFEGMSGASRRKAEVEFAKNAIENSRYRSTEEITKLLQAPLAEFRSTADPLLKLVAQSYDEVAPLSKRQDQFNNAIIKLRPEYVRGIQEMRKRSYYPDANLTLRFTYGEVKGYKPRDGVTYDSQTSLTGVIDKDTGQEPFDVPAGLKELSLKRDFGAYGDQRLNDVPVAFLATTDITGGNSGSPVMNGKGEIIGLAFDGNYEGLGGDYAFDPVLNRTIAVDIRYVLFVTEKFAGAGYLLNETQIKRAKGIAANK